MEKQIYLDFNASTPISQEVRAQMLPYLETHYGNPSAGHWASVIGKQAVEQSRNEVAKAVCCNPSEIVFTSGGTESNNCVIKGVFFQCYLSGKPFHVIISSIEHPSVVEACSFAKRLGGEVTVIPVDSVGSVNPTDVRKAIRPETALLSVMHANNEVGTIQPLAELGAIARENEVLFHTDAAQTIGKIAVNVEELAVDFLSIAGHKCYGPKGIGALYIKNNRVIEPLIHGGGHENGRRSGTESVPLIVGLGAACTLSASANSESMKVLRDRLHVTLDDRVKGGVVLNGHDTERLPNTLNVSFPGKDASDILSKLKGLAVSTGSSCHTNDREMSPVLKAMGVTPRIGFGSVRISLGLTTTVEDIDQAAELLVRALGA